MSIRSIDLQVLIPRATEASKTQQNSENQRAVQQQHFSAEWRQISTQRQTQVSHTSHAEEGMIRDALERDGNQGHQRRKQKRQSPESIDKAADEVTHDDPVRGNIIDIKT